MTRASSSSPSRAGTPSAVVRKTFIPTPVATRIEPKAITVPHVPAVEPPPVVVETPELHPAADFPAFDRAIYPFASIPNWGAMRTPEEWNRTYTQMNREDFVPVPAYDISLLKVPMSELTNPRNVDELTRKLFYSTHYFGAYDLDAAEFTAVHPGIDLKVALGTPVGAVAGGRVVTVKTDSMLGIHVIIEHRHPADGTFYSIYGHLGTATVTEGQDVAPGALIGLIGMTGNTSGPHLHLQIDRGEPGEANHRSYLPSAVPAASEAAKHVINPITFISRY